jgi:hypothetical protein
MRVLITYKSKNAAVNQRVLGSSPRGGAKLEKEAENQPLFLLYLLSKIFILSFYKYLVTRI